MRRAADNPGMSDVLPFVRGNSTLIQSISSAYHSVEHGKRFNERETAALGARIDRCDDPVQLREAQLFLGQGRMYEAEGTGGPDRVEFSKKAKGNESDKQVLEQLHTAVSARVTALGAEDVTYQPSPPASIDALAEGKKVDKPASQADRRYAVLIVDAHYDTDTAEGAEVPNMEAVLERANEKQLPVFEVVYLSGPRKTTNKDLTSHRKRDSWVKIEKYTWSSFIGTNLHDELMARGVTDLVLMGLSQEACVRETARAAKVLGYRVHTSFDIVQVLGQAVHEPDQEPDREFWTRSANAELADSYLDLPIFRDDVR